MKIGELAKSSNCPVPTIRYYEAEGLLLAPARSEGNFRIFHESDLERLLFIRQCRSLDMTLLEVRTLLTTRDSPEADCGEVNHVVDAHISKVRARIRELKVLERDLIELRSSCGAVRSVRECGILNGLAETY